MARQAIDLSSALGRWAIQLRKGVLEFVILLALDGRELYGFELISGVARETGIDLPEGTLYPLLLRLAADGLVSSRLAGGDGGAPRKYYTLTCSGRVLLAEMQPVWTRLVTAVDHLLPGVST